eukprot:TRINITY_DN7768_c0_g1_i1.p1 TRINITY_DN7768_c0_g1~~TRINITY_DN7768_c0_g1_i1.p1  ORF type:complete len:205 (+),score=43.26 TRINITY_DN7768_c0_g1_i1:296-910(+)
MWHPHRDQKRQMYGMDWKLLRSAQITENSVLRLAFHDCLKYKDGTGGCDGCLNWNGVGIPPHENNNKKQMYTWKAAQNTTNNGLHGITKALEAVYKTVNWPSGKSNTLKSLNLKKSLYQSGKSRADLWQLAGLIALENQIERANRACDLDYMARQQVTLLESRDKCEFKLWKPLKFVSGRSDCDSTEKGELRGLLPGRRRSNQW